MQKPNEPSPRMPIWLVLATVGALVYVIFRGITDGWDVLRVAMVVVFSIMVIYAAGAFVMTRRG